MIGEWVLSSSILIAVVILVRLVFKGRISLRLQYALWGLVLIRLLIPFNVGSSAFSVSNIATQVKQGAAAQVAFSSAQNVPSEQAEPDPVPSGLGVDTQEHISPLPGADTDGEVWGAPTVVGAQTVELKATGEPDGIQLLINAAYILWICGTVTVILALAAVNLVFGLRIRRTRVPIEHTESKLPVFKTAIVDSPCLFGLVRPSIYLNSDAVQDPKFLHHSIIHETTHYRHGDHIWSMLRCVCLAIHWYNPLVWWAASLSQRDAELACDESSIRRLGEQERQEYGHTLISMTCQKKANIFMFSTTMTDSGKGLRERIKLIAHKPKMAVYTLLTVLLIAAIAVGCTFTGGRDSSKISETEETGTTEPTVTTGQSDPTEPPPTEPAPPVFEEYSGLPLNAGTIYDALEEDKLCIAILQTQTASSMERFRYLIPGNQEVVVEILEKALQYQEARTEKNMSKGDYTGWTICYMGESYRVYTDGTIDIHYYYNGVIAPEYGNPVYAVCKAAAEEAGLLPVIRPNELTDIRSATLEWNGTHTVTDEAAMEFLESRFTNSVYQDGGAKCPFDALLTLELENGQTVQIRMATDSCAAWMSEGVAYSFKVLTEDGYKDNTEFYSLFAAEVIYEASKDGEDALWKYLPYIDWARYAEKYDANETLLLMDKMKNMILKDHEKYSVLYALYGAKGLDGYLSEHYATILGELYNMSKPEFAYYCFSAPYVENADLVLSLVAYDLGVSVEEVRAELKMLAE